MKVPFLFSGEGKDTIVVANHTENAQEFKFSIPFKVSTVVLDPDYWLISNGNITTSLNQQVVQKLNIYPNPAKNKLSIQIPEVLSVADLSITTIDGRLILKQLNLSNGLIEIDVSQYPLGTYMVSVQSGEKIYLNTLVIQ
jgi:hypothetical protein